uniref:Uncharacterized protein n=1 Tax=Hyaloperonospora arabidopsidis (strain Emoy2) TaxID=559515 RepID=M4BE34_HYAAE
MACFSFLLQVLTHRLNLFESHDIKRLTFVAQKMTKTEVYSRRSRRMKLLASVRKVECQTFKSYLPVCLCVCVCL